MITMCPE